MNRMTARTPGEGLPGDALIKRPVADSRAGCGLVLALLFAVQLVMHTNCDSLMMDDWTFFGVLELGQSIAAFLAKRWATWSSRLIIEGVLCLTTRSIWAWRVLDSAAFVLMAYSLCRLAGGERRADMVALGALAVTALPFGLLRNTGWQATTVNYIWPAACALSAAIPLADALDGRSEGRFSLLAVPAALFAANQEQTAAALVLSQGVLIAALLVKRRRVSVTVWLVLAVSIVELAAHLLCPGNALRAAQSVAAVNLRDYAQFSFVDKLSIGLTSTTAILFFGINPMLILFSASMLLTALARRRGLFAAAVCSAPLAMIPLCRLAWSLGESGPLSPLAAYGAFVLQLGPERIGLPGRMAAMFLMVTVLGLSAIAIYLSLGEREATACAVFLYAVGFAARMALSLSPTVVESGERTMVPLYAAMMLCTLLCVRDCAHDGSRRWPVACAFGVALLLAAMNVASSFALAA